MVFWPQGQCYFCSISILSLGWQQAGSNRSGSGWESPYRVTGPGERTTQRQLHLYHSGKDPSDTKAWNAATWQFFSTGNHICPVAQARELGVILNSSLSHPLSRSAAKFSCLSLQIISRLKTVFSPPELLLLSKLLPLPCRIVVVSNWAPCSTFDSFSFLSDHHREWILSPQHLIMNTFKQTAKRIFYSEPIYPQPWFYHDYTCFIMLSITRDSFKI